MGRVGVGLAASLFSLSLEGSGPADHAGGEGAKHDGPRLPPQLHGQSRRVGVPRRERLEGQEAGSSVIAHGRRW